MLALFATSCQKTESNSSPKSVLGYKPIYVAKSEAFLLTVKGPQAFTAPGKLFLYQNYIYMTDKGNGVHVIDNSNPVNPKKVAFIAIPGVVDAAVKSGIMYADNLSDLVAFDVSDVTNITFKTRVKDVYPLTSQFYPEFATGYFECVDTTKGYVIGWEESTLNYPKCYR